MSEGNGSAFLTRDDILKADDLPVEEVKVPEWSASKPVRVRGLTGSERGTWEERMSQVMPGRAGKEASVEFRLSEMRVTLCTLCMVDAEGQRLFTDHEVKLLGRKSAQALQRVYEVAARLSGISQEAVEEAAKSSGETHDSEAASASA